jgi:hypothetical protein
MFHILLPKTSVLLPKTSVLLPLTNRGHKIEELYNIE